MVFEFNGVNGGLGVANRKINHGEHGEKNERGEKGFEESRVRGLE